MVSLPDTRSPQTAVNLLFTRGKHGASGRIEWHDRPQGRVAVLALRGWIDLSAERRIEETLSEIAASGVSQLVVDCSQLRHVDYRLVPRLVDALARFEARSGGTVLCGLSHYLRDLLRLAGCEPQLRCWPSVEELWTRPSAVTEPSRECAS